MKMKLLTAITGLLCLSLNAFAEIQNKDSLPVIISGSIKNSNHDTVELIYFHNAIERLGLNPAQLCITDKKGLFFFKVQQYKSDIGLMLLYIRHRDGKNFYILDSGCPVEAGDSIFATVNQANGPFSTIFSGGNTSKYNAYMELKPALKKWMHSLEVLYGIDDERKPAASDSAAVSAYCLSSDSVLKEGLFYKKYKGVVSPRIYEILREETEGKIRENAVSHIGDIFSMAHFKKNYRMNDQALRLFDREFSNPRNNFQEEYLTDDYMSFLFRYYNIKLSYTIDRDSLYSLFSQAAMYTEIKNSYTGGAKNYVLASFIKAYAGFVKNSGGWVTDSLWRDLNESMAAGNLKNFIEQRLGRLSNGLDVIDFSMQEPDGKYIKLSGFKGKVILVDVWFTGCGGCLGYASRLESSIYPAFKNNQDLVFVSISGDRNKQTWIKSIAGGVYTRKENINVYTGGEGFDHPFLKYYNITGGPSTMLIDRDGKIAEASPPQNNMMELEKLIRDTLEK